MNKCPNPNFKEIECPYALSADSPLPCCGSKEACIRWGRLIQLQHIKDGEKNATKTK